MKKKGVQKLGLSSHRKVIQRMKGLPFLISKQKLSKISKVRSCALSDLCVAPTALHILSKVPDITINWLVTNHFSLAVVCVSHFGTYGINLSQCNADISRRTGNLKTIILCSKDRACN